MTDIASLERRIAAALERIGRDVDALSRRRPEAPDIPDAETVAALKTALSEERTARAEFEERVRAEERQREDETAAARRELADMGERLSAAETAVSRLTDANEELQRTNRALREANAEHRGDAALAETAMAAELEALRAQRAADRSELDALAAELAPLLEETEDSDARY